MFCKTGIAMKEKNNSNEEKKFKNIFQDDLYGDLLSFDYYAYRLENLVKKIKSKNYKSYSKACE